MELAYIPRGEGRSSVVQDNTQEGAVDLKPSIVLYEAQFLEFVHEDSIGENVEELRRYRATSVRHNSFGSDARVLRPHRAPPGRKVGHSKTDSPTQFECSSPEGGSAHCRLKWQSVRQ